MILSIDVGSVAVSAVICDRSGNVLGEFYRYHHGKVVNIISLLESELDLSKVTAVVTPSDSEWLKPSVTRYHTGRSLIAASKYFYRDIRALLQVGAARFQLMHFNEKGEFTHATTSTSCAAGTGSFLDQQAKRLDMSATSELSDLAEKNRDQLPEIASRCSVFAKTDLIHAQQAGYSLSAICDSLCRGLARNIADTLFDDLTVPPVVVFSGGVSLNKSVIRHLADLTGASFEVNSKSHLFPAIGAALLYLKDNHEDKFNGDFRMEDIIAQPSSERELVYGPLVLNLTDYPDFGSGTRKFIKPEISKHPGKVEMEVYAENKPGKSNRVFLGIDIGSTSTKAILIDTGGNPLAGFYTYTHGQPLNATMAIIEVMVEYGRSSGVVFDVLGVATTGSGRKFIGAIIGADLVIDEITTHARASVWLNPETDTIIEIGGQDAKFTRLKDGNVTFSRMNSVCAAGTGSFIEEQANKLEISLDDYSSVAGNMRSPLASDRCTVFMERDINYYLNQGYETGEILAAVLHSVRDNYLKKVAVESSIGTNVCFQGATARNKALVAAFEMKLGKKIYVSRYCHLTGALGSAIIAMEEHKGKSSFRGFGIIGTTITQENEVCELCNNHCRISVADINGEKVAYGFLCGRDYNIDKYVEKNISGFDLLKERKKAKKRINHDSVSSDKVIGLPAALHIFEEMTFWKHFFSSLGLKVVTSEKLDDPLETGKRLSGAEFCAPMHALHGHTAWLADKVDYIFIPAALQSRKHNGNNKSLYCYYTQFSPSVVSLINSEIKSKSIVPLLHYEKGERYVIDNLYNSLKKIDTLIITRDNVKKAYKYAGDTSATDDLAIKKLFIDNFRESDEMAVVLLGRPYLVLSESLNNGIPGIFGSLGVKTFYQDMLPVEKDDPGELEELFRSLPWHFASSVLASASYIARCRNLFPVFVTGFKCAPDSFAIDYFQQLLDSYGKPYLILQTDEHDSSVGYETRIEAAVRSFRNSLHESKSIERKKDDLVISPERKLSKKKTLLFPNWDQIAGRFLVANLQRYGFDARLLEHSDMGIRKAMATNTGQCLPLNIIAQDYISYIEKYNLNPETTILWMTETLLSCNIRMYPQYIRTILQRHGNGISGASVYTGELSHTEISPNLTLYAYFAYMLSGLLRRVGCRIRPYEVNRGETDRVLDESINLLEEAFQGKRRVELAIRDIVGRLEMIEKLPGQKPLVGIFGDFFVRDNDIMNQDLIHTIEKYGGEALTTPYSEYYKLIAENVLRRRNLVSHRLEMAGYRGLLIILKQLERKYLKYFEPFIGKANSVDALKLEGNLSKFNIDKYHSGESYDNILKIFHIIESYPSISLFVQTNPAFCCPSLITEAMKNEIRRQTGIPIVTITYDGTTEKKNDILAPYLS
jgi:predicted CoA-substrate-specific enzyme activase